MTGTRRFVAAAAVTLLLAFSAGCERKSPPPAAEPEKAPQAEEPGVIVTHTPEVQVIAPRGPLYDDEELPGFPHPTAEEQAEAKGLALLKEGKLDEARAAYGESRWRMERDLRSLAKEAVEKGRPARVFDFYRRLLDSRESLLWQEICASNWAETDTEYLALLRKLPVKDLDEPARQDLASAEVYKRLKGLIDEGRYDKPDDRKQFYDIADTYLTKYPKSRLALTAMLAAATAAKNEESAQGEDESAARIRKIDQVLDRMRAAGMSRRALNAVLTEIMCWTGELEDDHELTVRARKACEKIATQGEPGFRAEWLISAGDFALKAREENGQLARRLFTQTLSLAPGSRWAWNARDGLVRTHTEIDGPDAGLAALRDLEKQAPPDADFSLALWSLAGAYREAKQPERSIALLEEIIRAKPESIRAARAFREIAHIHKEAGDEPKMLAALEGAAALLPPDQPFDIADGCQRSFTYEELADYHVAKGNWSEALKWSLAWKVQTGCVNCDDADRATRRKYIALAYAQLGQVDECLSRAERLDERHVPEVARALVHVARKNGELDALVSKLGAIPPESKQAEFAKVALEYAQR